MNIKSGIYQIVNLVNNNIYIGSAVNLRNRKYLHISMLKRNIHHSIILQRAYNKYGLKNFSFEILEYVDVKNLIIREQFYIDKCNPKYNVCKIAGNTLGVESSRKKSVIQYDLEGNQIKIWNCLQDIKNHLKISASSKISECCKAKRNKAYGFVWRYLDKDYIPFSYKVEKSGKCIAEIDEESKILNVWFRIKDCAIDLNTRSSTLCNILCDTNRYKTLNGKLFKRITKEEYFKYREILEQQNKTNGNINRN